MYVVVYFEVCEIHALITWLHGNWNRDKYYFFSQLCT